MATYGGCNTHGVGCWSPACNVHSAGSGEIRDNGIAVITSILAHWVENFDRGQTDSCFRIFLEIIRFRV